MKRAHPTSWRFPPTSRHCHTLGLLLAALLTLVVGPAGSSAVVGPPPGSTFVA